MKKSILLICLLLCISLTACNFEIKLGDSVITNKDTNMEDVNENMKDEKDENKSFWDDVEDEDDEDTNFWDDKEEDIKENENKVEEDKNEVNNTTSNPKSFADQAKKSTLNNPINMGDVGIALQCYYNDGEYTGEPIYIRIKEKLSKAKATEVAENYNKDAIFRYELSEGIEWAGVLVEIDLRDYPITFEKGSRPTSMTPSLRRTSLKEGSIVWKDNLYFLVGDIVEPVKPDQNLFQGDIFECYFVYSMPEGFDEEYLIKATSYDSTEHAYFLIK